MVDYIFFVPLKECRLLEAYCVVTKVGNDPIICPLDYSAIHEHAGIATKLLQSNTSDIARANSELCTLARLLFPQALIDITSQIIDHLYVSPDTDITLIPFDSLPVKLGS